MMVLSKVKGAIKFNWSNVRVKSISKNSIVLKIEGYEDVVELKKDDVINFDEIKEELNETYVFNS